MQIGKELFAAMGCGDLQGVLALTAGDVEWVVTASARWPARTAGMRDWLILFRRLLIWRLQTLADAVMTASAVAVAGGLA